jgi:hypothetical protein
MSKGKNPYLFFLILMSLIVVSFLGCQSSVLHLNGKWLVAAIEINKNVYSINQTASFLKHVQFNDEVARFEYGNEWHNFAFGLDAVFTYKWDRNHNTIILTDSNNVKHIVHYKWDGAMLVLQNWSSSLVNVIGEGSPIGYIKLHKK